ncbi:MAG: type I-U CRISPR-associated helicase/endonuclease Cas3 [Planctomycetaceae bacterium]
MTDKTGFAEMFSAATGNPPFPWQVALYERFVSDRHDNIPSFCEIPTGLGKTSVVAIWLIARANYPDKMPRRLVYIVNRRTVVDQTTDEVVKLHRNLEEQPACRSLRDGVGSFAISTLRGQFADNGEWFADPSRPAVICGTVDMIGSRLLFSGYRIGFKSRPLHAGFLGQDALLVHDEAHLEPAFQKLIKKIKKEQHEVERTGDLPWPKLRVMALSATARNATDENATIFTLTNEDIKHSIVAQRYVATKTLHLHLCDDEKKKLVSQVVERALEHKESGDTVVVFLRGVDDALDVFGKLQSACPENVAPLTGTMRGFERDELVRNPVFVRFLQESDRPKNVKPSEGTVYLVCTSAGEVGVNISADHMVCDLSTFDSMAQRFGRVNRFGKRDDTRIDVVFPKSFDEKHPLTLARKATLALLQQLDDDASPKALAELPENRRLEAFAPEPAILPATDILFDAWALTTIREKIPGRPPVEPYLHGIAKWEPPRTSIAWRDEVDHITTELLEREGEDFPQSLLADYPLKPHELLSDISERVLTELQHLASDHPETLIWVVDKQGEVTVRSLYQIATPAATKKSEKERLLEVIAEGIVLLPPSIGGMTSQGTLNGKAVHDTDHPNGYDIADRWFDENGQPYRKRVWGDEPPSSAMALIRTIDIDPLAEELESLDEQADRKSERKRFWQWYSRPRNAEDVTPASTSPISWKHHTDDVVNETKKLVNALNLPDDLKQAIVLAAEFHDLGKRRELWQRSIGNPNPSDWYAKPGKPANGPRWRLRRLSHYRHEFGSLLDAIDPNQEHAPRLAGLSAEMQDVVLHLIAAHHGYARPHFRPEGIVDPDPPTANGNEVATEVMRRFARLQRRYGRWGLAYLESLLRAADWAASASPSESEGEA